MCILSLDIVETHPPSDKLGVKEGPSVRLHLSRVDNRLTLGIIIIIIICCKANVLGIITMHLLTHNSRQEQQHRHWGAGAGAGAGTRDHHGRQAPSRCYANLRFAEFRVQHNDMQQEEEEQQRKNRQTP